MHTCSRCGRLITNPQAQFCPNCGQTLAPAQPEAATVSQAGNSAPPLPVDQPQAPTSAAEAPQPATPAPFGAPPSMPYGMPAQPSVPYGMPAPPSQPMYGPPYGPAYGQPPTQPPYGQAPSQNGYPGAYPGTYPSGYPGAYQPGAGWRPADQPAPRPWGRIIGIAFGALILVAIVVSVIYNVAVPHPTAHVNTNATATAQAIAANTLLADPLTGNANGWANDSHCFFGQDGYYIHDGYICFAPIGVQTDGTESATVKQVSGPLTYSYGLVFRRASEGNYYFFGIDSNSKWDFDKVVNDQVTRLQEFTSNSAIHGGLNAENTISVTMIGSTFDCYVNGVKVGTIHDSTYGEGEWGLAGDTGLVVVYTNYLARR